jgi:hypothetical protein
VAREIKQDTTELLNQSSSIKDDTAHILAEITRLRAQLPQESQRNIVLERYLDNLTSYAASVADTYEEDLQLTSFEETLVEQRAIESTPSGQVQERYPAPALHERPSDTSRESKEDRILRPYPIGEETLRLHNGQRPSVYQNQASSSLASAASNITRRIRPESPPTLNSSEQLVDDVHGTGKVDTPLLDSVHPFGPINSLQEHAGRPALVLHDFTKANDNELTLTKGKFITALKTKDSNWWYGINGQHQRGWFPRGYVDDSWSPPSGSIVNAFPSNHMKTEIRSGVVEEVLEPDDMSASPNLPNPAKKTPALRRPRVLDIEVPRDIIRNMRVPPLAGETERTHIRYTAVTCTADRFLAEDYQLRQTILNRPRNTEILFMIDLMSSDATAVKLESALRKINFLNLLWEKYLQVSSRSKFIAKCPIPWQGIVVCLNLNGWDNSPRAVKIRSKLEKMGVLPPWSRLMKICSSELPSAEFHGDHKRELQFSLPGADYHEDTLLHLFEVCFLILSKLIRFAHMFSTLSYWGQIQTLIKPTSDQCN